MGSGVYKSTNKGATWTQLGGTNATTTIVATATTLYTTNANNGATTAQFRHARITNDNTWVNDSSPQAMRGGFDMTVTFDGSHYILLGGMWETGIWRYVEPASGTGAISPANDSRTHKAMIPARATISLSSKSASSQAPMYGLRGERISSSGISRNKLMVFKRQDMTKSKSAVGR
jgi:hypothetical protein